MTFITKENVQVIISIDTKQAVANVDKFNKELAQNLDVLNGLEAGTKDWSDQLKKVQQSQRDLLKNQTLKQVRSEYNKLRREVSNTTEGTKEFAVASARLDVVRGRFKQLNAQVRGVNNSVNKAPKGLAAFATSARAAWIAATAGLAALIFALQKVFGFIGNAADQSGELELIKRRFDVVFGEAAESVREFGEQNAASLGLSIREFEKATAATQDLLVPLGFNRDVASDLTIEITELSSALALWEGGTKSVGETQIILNKALLGEREALQALGVKISEEQVKRELQLEGLDQLQDKQLQQARALVTLKLLQEQSTDAVTNATDETFLLARAQAEANARFQNAKDQIYGGITEGLKSIAIAATPVLEFLADNVDLLINGVNSGNRFGLTMTLVALKIRKFFSDISVLISNSRAAQFLLGDNFVPAEIDENINDRIAQFENALDQLDQKEENRRKDRAKREIQSQQNINQKIAQLRDSNSNQAAEDAANKIAEKASKAAVKTAQKLIDLGDKLRINFELEPPEEFESRLQEAQAKLNAAAKKALSGRNLDDIVADSLNSFNEDDEADIAANDLGDFTNDPAIQGEISKQEQLLQVRQDFAQRNADLQADALQQIGTAFGDFFTNQEKDAAAFGKLILKITLDIVEKQILLSIAQAQAASLASTQSVATGGIAGLAQAALLTGLIKGAFAAIKSQILEKGGFINEQGGVAQGSRHRSGGINMYDGRTGQWVGQVEGGEPVISRATYAQNKSVVDALIYNGQHRNGAPIFQDGGIIPSSNVISGRNSSSSVITNNTTVQQTQLTVRAFVPIDEVEQALLEREAARQDNRF